MAEGWTSLITFSYCQIVQPGSKERVLQSVILNEAIAVHKGASETV